MKYSKTLLSLAQIIILARPRIHCFSLVHTNTLNCKSIEFVALPGSCQSFLVYFFFFFTLSNLCLVTCSKSSPNFLAVLDWFRGNMPFKALLSQIQGSELQWLGKGRKIFSFACRKYGDVTAPYGQSFPCLVSYGSHTTIILCFVLFIGYMTNFFGMHSMLTQCFCCRASYFKE